jgi:hypothetical protein
MFTKQTRAIAAAAAASIAFTAFSLSPAAAGPLPTQVSYRHDGGGAYAAIAGTIAMIAATHHDNGPYYEGPYGYAPAPYAYAPHYGSSNWGGWHGHWHRR